MIKIGILSDTHIPQATNSFMQQTEACFSDVSMIFHAGDLTSTNILKAFDKKEIHAVHGNMCDYPCSQLLPAKTTVRVKDYTIGIIHRTGYTYDFEDQLIDEFDGVDCIVYGHTHRPVCKKVGNLLLVNPGSFTGTGKYGAPGTYAIMEIDNEIRCRLLEVPR